jgi:hypothetical protein
MAQEIDHISCGKQPLESDRLAAAGMPVTALPLPQGASRSEMSRYFSHVGLGHSDQQSLLYSDMPLRHISAVDKLSSAPGLSGVDTESIRRLFAYYVIMRNIDCFSGGYSANP